MKTPRLLAVMFWLATTALLPFTSAYADNSWQATNGLVTGNTVQFDYRGGSAVYATTVPDSSTVTVVVNNTIANCIGTCEPIPDVWTVSINGQTYLGNVIEIINLTAQVSGQLTIVATGRDVGFWGGWYGPIITVSITSPAPMPAPTNDANPTPSATPEPSVLPSATPTPTPSPSATLDITPSPTPTLETTTASSTPIPSPTPEPTPSITATPEPTPSPTPTVEPTPSPSPEPTPTETAQPVAPAPQPPAPEPTPQPAPQPDPVVAPQPVKEPDPVAPAPDPQPLPDPQPDPQPAPADPIPADPQPIPADPIPDPAPVDPQPVAQPDPVAPTPPDPITPTQPAPVVVASPIAVDPAPVSIANVDVNTLPPDTPVELANGVVLTAEVVVALQALDNPAELLTDLFTDPAKVFMAIANIGADMSPEARAKSQDVVVATVVTGNIAAATAITGYRRKP